MIAYYKLLDYLNRQRISKEEFRKLVKISPATMAKISKNEYVALEVIDRICEILECQPDNIIEHISDQTEEDEMGYTTEIKYMLNEFDEPINITDCRITNDEKNKKFIQDIIDSQNNKAPISKSNKKQ